MDVGELWRGMVPTCKDKILGLNHCYEQVVASRLGLEIGAEDMRVLMQDGTTAAWEQLRVVWISNTAALNAPLYSCEVLSPPSRVHLPSAFAISSICTIHYFAEAVQDPVDCIGGITFRYRFCTAVRCEMSLCVIEGLLAKFALRERLLMLDESIMGAPCNLDRSFGAWPHLTNTVIELLHHRTQNHLFDSRHHNLVVDLFTGELTVWIYASTFTPPGPSMPVRPRYDQNYLFHHPCR